MYISRTSAAVPGWSPFADSALLTLQSAEGAIEKVDVRRHRVQLAGGEWYVAPFLLDIKSLLAGEKVEVIYAAMRQRNYPRPLNRYDVGVFSSPVLACGGVAR